jgi:hypothetical protein
VYDLAAAERLERGRHARRDARAARALE